MTCGKIRRKLDQFLSRELPDAELREIESHLAGCIACRAGAASLKRWKRQIRTAGSDFSKKRKAFISSRICWKRLGGDDSGPAGRE